MFAISLLNVFATQNLFLWKVSILSSEFGHYLAIAALIVLYLGRRNKKVVVLSFVATVFLLLPVYGAYKIEANLRQNFERNFQSHIDNSLISATGLILHTLPEQVAYERYVYSDSLNLDLYRNIAKPQASPWVLVIHGGGWNNGNTEQLPDLNWYLARHGYSVVSVTYHFTPKFIWPTQKEDMYRAIDYLTKHSAEFGLDMNRFFVLGRSAGAQIAGVLAYEHKYPGIKGYIDFYGPTDLTFGYEAGDENDILHSRNLLREFLGGTPYDHAANYKDASVIEQYEQNAKPIPALILHGDLDRLVWFKHSERLAFRMQPRNTPFEFVQMPWATHGFDFNLAGPSGQISTNLIEHFLNTLAQAQPNFGPNIGPNIVPNIVKDTK